MGKRQLVIAGVYGQFHVFLNVLAKAKYHFSRDQLILLGDYVSKGSQSKEVLEFITYMVKTYNVVALRGDYEEMFLMWLKEGNARFLKNGGLEALKSYMGKEWIPSSSQLEDARQHIYTHYAHHVAFLESLPYFYETEQHIFVHGGINPLYQNWKDTPKEELILTPAPFFSEKLQFSKPVVFGHISCSDIHCSSRVWYGTNRIGINGAVYNFGGQLNCLEIKEGEYKDYSYSKAPQISIA